MTDATPPPLTRTIHVDSLEHPHDVDRVKQTLGAVAGVRDVAATKGAVRITYDPTQVRLDTLEGEITTLGHALSTGWLHRLRRTWGHFSEQNVIDNLAHEGHCCSKPPKGR